jgi:ketosteroid isomerase-like protein
MQSEPTQPARLVEELHRRQAAMYAGGPVDAVAEMLAENVVWHVPGRSPIAGEHRGREAVIEAGRVAEAWLVPSDLAKFDRIWGRAA